MASTFESLLLAQTSFSMNRPIAVMMQVTTTTSLTSGTWTSIGMDSSTIDNYNGHSNSTNNSRYTVQVAGKYVVSGTVAFATNATGDRGAKITKNGAVVQGPYALTSSASTTHGISVATAGFIIACNVGDYLELQGYQNSGGALATQISTDQDSFFSVYWISS